MKLTNKSSVVIILGSVISPLLVCILLFVLGYRTDTLVLAAGYTVFGLPILLVTGWILSLTAKNSKKPLMWTTLGYSMPALLLNFAIIALALSA